MKSSSLRLRVAAIEPKSRSRGDVDWDALSPRERVVTQLVIKGSANKEIARELKVTEGTVKTHLHRIYRKLGVTGRFALAIVSKKARSGGRRSEDHSVKLPKSKLSAL